MFVYHLIQDVSARMNRDYIFYFRYCKGLKFSQTPDYDYLKGLFRACLSRHKLKEDGVFDWSPFDGALSLQNGSMNRQNHSTLNSSN